MWIWQTGEEVPQEIHILYSGISRRGTTLLDTKELPRYLRARAFPLHHTNVDRSPWGHKKLHSKKMKNDLPNKKGIFSLMIWDWLKCEESNFISLYIFKILSKTFLVFLVQCSLKQGNLCLWMSPDNDFHRFLFFGGRKYFFWLFFGFFLWFFFLPKFPIFQFHCLLIFE